jgi:hypothetical protein
MSAKSLDALLLGWNSSILRKFSNNQFDLPMLRMCDNKEWSSGHPKMSLPLDFSQ